MRGSQRAGGLDAIVVSGVDVGSGKGDLGKTKKI